MSDSLPDILAPFLTNKQFANSVDIPVDLAELSKASIPICSVTTRIDDREYLVQCWLNDAGYLIEFESAGRFAITATGDQIIHLDADNSVVVSGNVITTLLGPALCLALALQGTFTLHASAVQVGDQAIAFIGDSGMGKSTLAAYLSDPIVGWQRLSDDVLPIAFGLAGIDALPHYPQYRLGADQSVRFGVSEGLSLTSIYLLDIPSVLTKPQITPLKLRDRVSTLLFHTMGPRLFSPSLLVDHMRFCTEVAKQVPIKRLIYPHKREMLQVVHRLLREDVLR